MKKKTVKNVLYYVVLAVLVAVFCFSAYKIYSYYAEKRESTRLNETVAREYLAPLRREGLDTLILGCTHYPLLTDIIGHIMGPGVTLINTGEEAAWELKRTLRGLDLLAPEGPAAGPPSAPATSPSSSGSWRPIS